MAETFYQKKNNSKSTLSAAITSSATSLQIPNSDTGKFPTVAPFPITIFYATNDISTSEIALVTLVSANTFTITRAQEGTTAQAFDPANGVVNIWLTDTAGGQTQQDTSLITGWVPVVDAWTYSSYDSTNVTGVITVPTDATLTYSLGMRVKFTQSSVVQYGIITGVTSTTLTVYFGTSYSLANSAISAIYYSSVKAPFGFPLNKDIWTVLVSNATDQSQSFPINGTWYNNGSIAISVPIGAWELSYIVAASYGNSSSTCDQQISLSTSPSSNTDTGYQTDSRFALGGVTTLNVQWQASFSKNAIVTVATNHYLITQSSNTASFIAFYGSIVPTRIKAVCAYL